MPRHGGSSARRLHQKRTIDRRGITEDKNATHPWATKRMKLPEGADRRLLLDHPQTSQRNPAACPGAIPAARALGLGRQLGHRHPPLRYDVDTVYLASGPGKIAGHVDGDGQHASLPDLLHLKANCIADVSVQHNFVANCIESP
jgi:hypothetical protein